MQNNNNSYFQNHPLEPKKISDLIDNMESYIEEMRANGDEEVLPAQLRQYAGEYFIAVEFDV